MYKDKIEISSLGGLPHDVSKEEYLSGAILVLKNPIVGNIFFRLNLIEALGTGIRRINEAYTDYEIKPNYTILENSISVELPIKKAQYQITNDEAEIILTLKNGRRLSSNEIAEETGYSKSKVLRLMKNLLDKNYVVILGGGRSTKYKLR